MVSLLVTGGSGYIGSQFCHSLPPNRYHYSIFDRIEPSFTRSFIKGDLLDKESLRKAFRSFKPKVVIHFAALIEVGESVIDPQKYYLNNVVGTLNLLEVMREERVSKLIFSSTAAVYGIPKETPIKESFIKDPINPYGRSKSMMEEIIQDFARAYCDMQFVIFRYFNAAGADLERRAGPRKQGGSHLIPRVFQTAWGQFPHLEIYGDTYPTPDGTCIRDYIHTLDLALAHQKGVEYLLDGGTSLICNLGTGQGFSVKEVVEKAEQLLKRPLIKMMKEKRAGDPPVLVADPTLAQKALSWKAQHSDLDTILNSTLKWFQKESHS